MGKVDTVSRRQFLRAGGAAALAGGAIPLLIACGGGNSGSGGASVSSLKFSNDKATWKPWFQALGQASKKATGIDLNLAEYADTNTFQATIRTSAGTPKTPDLYSWWSGWLMKEIVDAGIAADVSDLWKSAGSAYGQDLRNAFTFNGKAYGVPLNFSYWVTLYNKKVFDKYQLSAPTTWDELTHVAETLKSNGVIPFGATIDGRWPTFIYFSEFVIRADPNLYQQLMAGKAKYTDPGVVHAMQTWGQWIKNGYFTNPSSVTFGTGSNNFVDWFAQGKSAMVQMGTWYEPTLNAAGLKAGVDYDAFIWPAMSGANGNTVIFETGPVVLAAHGAHQDAGKKLFTWFMSKEGQQAWNKASGFTPARGDVPSTSTVDQHLAKTITSGGYKQLNRYWEATPHDIVETAVDQFAKFMLSPGDPTSILQGIQTKADSVWSTVK